MINCIISSVPRAPFPSSLCHSGPAGALAFEFRHSAVLFRVERLAADHLRIYQVDVDGMSVARKVDPFRRHFALGFKSFV